jgi:uncharacterized BrkB/YihY/UPF0761 family membrane protein
MEINWSWPILAAVILIVLKQGFRLYIFHKPDRVDYLKALASLPLDVSFLIISLFVKAVMEPQHGAQILVVFLLIYLLCSIISTVLWRVCDGSVLTKLGGHYYWAFPMNLSISSVMFYLALQHVK